MAYANLAGALWRQGRKQEARKMASYAVTKGATDHWLLKQWSKTALNKTISHNKQRQWIEAEAAGWEAQLWNPKSAPVHNALGNALFGQKKYKTAEEIYRVAVQLKPQVGLYYANLAGALYKQGKMQEAVKMAMKAKQHKSIPHWIFKRLNME
jgi:Flp pilus assembly protein TadD